MAHRSLHHAFARQWPVVLLCTVLALLLHAVMLLGVPHGIDWMELARTQDAPEMQIAPLLTRSIQPAPKPVSPPVVPAPVADLSPAVEIQTNTAALPEVAVEPPSQGVEPAQPAQVEPIPPVQTPQTVDVGVTVAYEPPPTTTLFYNIKGKASGITLNLDGTLQWKREGDAYQARLEVSHFLLGSRVQTSTGFVTQTGLEPSQLGDKTSRSEEIFAKFDRQNNRVIFSASNEQVPLQAAAQDQLSVFLQLGAMLQRAPEQFVLGHKESFQAIGVRGPETWEFQVVGSERLEVEYGSIRGLKLSRTRHSDADTQVDVWLAPDMHYLPVRIRIEQSNGDLVDQTWQGFKP